MISSDDKIMYSGGLNCKIRIWNLENNQQIGMLRGHTNNIRCMTLSSDNKFLYSGSTD